MANQEHVDRLIGGVEGWNRWRKLAAILSGLTKADLLGADLTGADLMLSDN